MDGTETRKARKTVTIPWKLIIGAGIGAAVGYLYYYFVGLGCATGTCPITSNPLMSVLYGAAMGALISRI